MDARTDMRLHKDAPKLLPVDNNLGFSLAPCHAAGVCICADGGMLSRLRQNMVELLRPALRVQQQKAGTEKTKSKKPAARLLMEQAMLVFKFESAPTATAHVLPDPNCNWEQVSREVAGDLQIAPVSDLGTFAKKTLWAHVPYGHFRDWKFTFLFLEETGQGEKRCSRTGQALTELRVPVHAEFLTDVVAFQQKFDLDCAWQMSLRVIYLDDEQLPLFDTSPDVVEVMRQSTVPDMWIWKAQHCQTCACVCVCCKSRWCHVLVVDSSPVAGSPT